MNNTGTSLVKGPTFSLERVEANYICNLQGMVRMLARVISQLCNEQNTNNETIEAIRSLQSEIAWQQKMKDSIDNTERLSLCIGDALDLLTSNHQSFPTIKHMRSHQKADLSTIDQKYSQQNLLANYMHKSSQQKQNPRHLSKLEHYSGSTHTVEVNREQTRRSLEIAPNKSKKQIYSQLQKMKTKQAYYLHPKYTQHKKFNVQKRLPTYNISKLI